MIIADTNEFHPLVDGAKYRNSHEPDGSAHPVIIMRVTYSNTHLDNAYAASLVQARAANLLVGHYGYMIAGVDAAAQGAFFGMSVKNHGGLRLGDTIWCDDEEGTGDQAKRVTAFLTAAHAILHSNALAQGVYSGAVFYKAHNLASLPTGDLRWIAAYGAGDPNIAGEDLWQFTDHRVIPGVSGPCDASIFTGTVDDILKMVGAAVPVGPFRHAIQPGDNVTLDAIANRRNMDIHKLVDVSLQNLSPENAAILNAYMDLRKALRSVGKPFPIAPVGLVYWTINP